MLVNHDCKVHLSACKEPGRLAISAVLLRVFDGAPQLVATNGKILSVCPLELEADEKLPERDYLIPLEAFKEMIKGRRNEVRTITVLEDSGNGILSLRRGGSLQRVECAEGGFPRVDAVIDQPAPKFRVTLSSDYLAQLIKSLGSESLVFEFTDDRSPVIVKGGDSDGHPSDTLGIIMPMVKP